MSDEFAARLHKEGVALFRQDKFEEALQKLNEALQNTTEDSRRTAEIYNDLGVVYQNLEDYPAAHQALDEAEARFLALADEKDTWKKQLTPTKHLPRC